MRGVGKAVGKIEAVPTDFGGRKVWLVHAHLLLDVDGKPDMKVVRGDLRRVTHRRNSYFDIEPIISGAAVTAYITKARDVCPDPGRFTLEQFEQIMLTFKHKELLVSWGVGRRGKKARPSAAALPVSSFVPVRVAKHMPKATGVTHASGLPVVWRVTRCLGTRSPRSTMLVRPSDGGETRGREYRGEVGEGAGGGRAQGDRHRPCEHESD
jgi:hypothetical protein